MTATRIINRLLEDEDDFGIKSFLRDPIEGKWFEGGYYYNDANGLYYYVLPALPTTGELDIRVIRVSFGGLTSVTVSVMKRSYLLKIAKECSNLPFGTRLRNKCNRVAATVKAGKLF